MYNAVKPAGRLLTMPCRMRKKTAARSGAAALTQNKIKKQSVVQPGDWQKKLVARQ